MQCVAQTHAVVQLLVPFSTYACSGATHALTDFELREDISVNESRVEAKASGECYHARLMSDVVLCLDQHFQEVSISCSEKPTCTGGIGCSGTRPR
eukprot:1859587-Amphidinium_carterae.1